MENLSKCKEIMTRQKENDQTFHIIKNSINVLA